jgi:hypothetical protein
MRFVAGVGWLTGPIVVAGVEIWVAELATTLRRTSWGCLRIAMTVVMVWISIRVQRISDLPGSITIMLKV